MVTANSTRLLRNMEHHVEEIAGALRRVPYMRQSQLARYVGVTDMRIHRLVTRYTNDTFERMLYDQKIHRGSWYHIGNQGTQQLICLSEKGRHQSPQGNIRAVRSQSVGRILATGEMLLALKKAGVFLNPWDIRVPSEPHASVHAWVQHKDDEYPDMGLYLLPHRKELWVGKKSVMRGIIHRTIQNIKVAHLVFIALAGQYETALAYASKMEYGAGTLYVLPWESFLRDPGYFLHAIRHSRHALDWYTMVNTPKRKLPIPISHAAYGALIEDQAGVYKLIDWWNGDAKRVQAWLEDFKERVYLIPDDPGKAAAGWVYVVDPVMRDALDKLLQSRGALAQVYPASEAYD